MYIKYVCFVILSLLASIINLVLAPFVVLFASNDGWLPKWLSWFQTPDNPLDGDGGWRQFHMPFIKETNKFKRYVNRVFWLYRNPMYNFDINVLGVVIDSTFKYTESGDKEVSNFPFKEGKMERRLLINGKTYFQYYYIKKLTSTRCLRINLGWKLWGSLDKGQRKQLVFFVNPFTKYSLKK